MLSVSEHIRTLCSVFEGAFPLENPMPFLLENAIEKVYKKKGWYPDTKYAEDGMLEFPTMSMLYEELEKELAGAEPMDAARIRAELEQVSAELSGLHRKRTDASIRISAS